MPKYAALLRGISPSGRNMGNQHLRGVFESLGFANVASVISSGNILFESPRKDVAVMQRHIEEALFAQLGFHSTTIIRSQRELQDLAHKSPFKSLQHGREAYLIVTFFKHPAKNTDQQDWMNGTDYKLAALYPGEICSIVDTTATKTPAIMSQLEKHYGKEITTRTFKTVERILKAFES
jgi:uncharacterized protein (DUF1697 family)